MGKKGIRVLIFTLGFIIVCLGNTAYSENIKKVAVMPFKINADRDLSFLQEGIVDMLSSRLAWKDKVVVAEERLVKEELTRLKGRLDKDAGIKAGKSLGADYVIIGSLTVFGESVSMDASILDVDKGEKLVTAFNQSKGMDEVIPAINQFAKDINAKILGRSTREPVYVQKPGGTEKRSGLIKVAEGLQKKDIGHVQSFKTGIIGMDSGDVDGDGKDELVCIDSDTVYIYKWQEKAFAELRKIQGSWSPEFVYVSIGDMDKNGREEIYVSNLAGSTLSSFVLEWSSGDFKVISKGQRWFFRVVNLPDKGETLIGQKRLTGGGFSGHVYVLNRDGNHFTKAEPLTLPSMANVFNFVKGSLTGGGSVETMVLSPETEFLFLVTQDGDRIWKSEDEFGGLDIHMVAQGRDVGTEKWFHFSPPMLLSDLDNNGIKEVVVCKNKSSINRMTEKNRMFSSGRMHFLQWDGLSIATKWKTKDMPGPITGYCLKKSQDGQGLELVLSIQKSSGRSQIIMYNVE